MTDCCARAQFLPGHRVITRDLTPWTCSCGYDGNTPGDFVTYAMWHEPHRHIFLLDADNLVTCPGCGKLITMIHLDCTRHVLAASDPSAFQESHWMPSPVWSVSLIARNRFNAFFPATFTPDDGLTWTAGVQPETADIVGWLDNDLLYDALRRVYDALYDHGAL